MPIPCICSRGYRVMALGMGESIVKVREGSEPIISSFGSGIRPLPMVCAGLARPRKNLSLQTVVFRHLIYGSSVANLCGVGEVLSGVLAISGCVRTLGVRSTRVLNLRRDQGCVRAGGGYHVSLRLIPNFRTF